MAAKLELRISFEFENAAESQSRSLLQYIDELCVCLIHSQLGTPNWACDKKSVDE